MVWRAVAVRGRPQDGVCCGVAWPPSLWGVVRWCAAPLIVGHAVVVCGPPHGRACCIGAWPPLLWGVLCWCWCLCSLSAVFFWPVVPLPGGLGRAGLWSACGAPPLCPWRDGRAGLPSASGAPLRVVVSRLSSPCRSFSLVRPPPSCLCAVAGRVLAIVLALLCFPPPSRGCRRRAAVLPLSSPCLLVAAVGRPLPPFRLVRVLWVFCCSFSCARALLCPCCGPFQCSAAVLVFCFPGPPAPARSGSVAVLLLVFLCARSAVFAPPFRCSCVPAAPLHSWFLLRGCWRPAACFSLCALCLVCWRWLLCPPIAPSPPLLPQFVLNGCFCPAPLCSFCLLAAARSFVVGFRLVLPPPPPRPPRAWFCVAGVVASVAWCFAVLPAVLWGPVPCGAVSFCPSCLVRCRPVLFSVAVCCMVSFGAVWRRGVWRGAVRVALPCCSLFCCSLRPGVLWRCGVLFTLCLAVPSWSAFLCAVLCLLALCCAALRPAAPCREVLLRTVLAAWCCAAFSRAVACCFVLCRALECCVLCCVLCCAILCCCVLWCALGCGAWVRCAVLFALCLVCFVWVCVSVCCPVMCVLVLCCAVLRCVLLFRAVLCCCALCSVRGAVLLFLALFGAALCCALFSGVVRCCGVLCRLVRRFAVLPCAVCAVLCVFCRCAVVCAVFAAVRRAAGALWCPAVCAVTSVRFQKLKTCFQRTPAVPCAPCPPRPQQNHTLKKAACFNYLFSGLACTPGCVVELLRCVPG